MFYALEQFPRTGSALTGAGLPHRHRDSRPGFLVGPQSDQDMALLLTSRHPVASQVTGPQGVPEGDHRSGSVRQPTGQRARVKLAAGGTRRVWGTASWKEEGARAKPVTPGKPHGLFESGQGT